MPRQPRFERCQLALVDTVAERMQTLGSVAIGDPRHVAEITRVPRPPDGVEEVPAMLSGLLGAHEIILDTRTTPRSGRPSSATTAPMTCSSRT